MINFKTPLDSDRRYCRAMKTESLGMGGRGLETGSHGVTVLKSTSQQPTANRFQASKQTPFTKFPIKV
jgi:hypothetical protein